MKRFKLEANCQFDAENIDDAFLKLQEYFGSLLSDELFEIESPFIAGEIHIEPVKPNGAYISAFE